MFRTIVVLTMFAIGLFQALRGPFNSLLLYLWVAHFRPQWWAWEHWLYQIPMSYLAAVLVLGYTLLVHRRYTLNPLQVFMILFCIWAVVSAAHSLSPIQSHFWVEQFVRVVVITYVLSILVDDMPKLRLALLVICFSMGAEPAKQGIVNLILHPGAENVNKIPHLGDNNGVGLSMVMLFALTLGLYRSSVNRWEKILLWLLGFGVLMRAVTTYSRGTFLTLAVLTFLLWLQSKHKVRIAAVVLTGVIALAAVMPDRYFERMKTITYAFSDEAKLDNSAASRFHLWSVAVIMANDRPLFGVGFDAYKYLYRRYDPTGGEYGRIKAAHGSFPGVLGDMGYPGVTLYALVVLTALLYAARTWRMARAVEGSEAIAEIALGTRNAIICFLVGGAFLSYMYYENVWHTFGIAATLPAILTRELARGREPARLEGEDAGAREFAPG
jgi:probable O-glycosylation ligase (exosortase A-associated)